MKFDHKHIIIPKIGLTFSRKLLPQLGSTDELLKNLQKHNINYKHISIDPGKLKSSQSEFNKDAVLGIMKKPRQTPSSIIISNDGHVLDGHHRWIANFNKGERTKAVQVDMPILDLMRLVQTFKNTHYKDKDNIRSTIKQVVSEAIINKKYK